MRGCGFLRPGGSRKNRGGDLALAQGEKRARLDGGPDLVAGQRPGGDHGDAIIRPGFLGEIHLAVLVDQRGLSEGRAAGEAGEFLAAKGIERAAVAHQHIEHAHARQRQAQRGDFAVELFRRGQRFVARAQLVEHPAKGVLAVGRANGRVKIERQGFDAAQLAVMGESPDAAPEFARKGMGVGKGDLAAIGLPDMGDHGAALDRMRADEAGHVGFGAGFGIEKGAHGASLVKGDAPAIAMRTRAAAARGQSGEGKSNVGGDIRAHSEKFTHLRRSLGPRREARVC